MEATGKPLRCTLLYLPLPATHVGLELKKVATVLCFMHTLFE